MAKSLPRFMAAHTSLELKLNTRLNTYHNYMMSVLQEIKPI